MVRKYILEIMKSWSDSPGKLQILNWNTAHWRFWNGQSISSGEATIVLYSNENSTFFDLTRLGRTLSALSKYALVFWKSNPRNFIDHYCDSEFFVKSRNYSIHSSENTTFKKLQFFSFHQKAWVLQVPKMWSFLKFEQ